MSELARAVCAVGTATEATASVDVRTRKPCIYHCLINLFSELIYEMEVQSVISFVVKGVFEHLVVIIILQTELESALFCLFAEYLPKYAESIFHFVVYENIVIML